MIRLSDSEWISGLLKETYSKKLFPKVVRKLNSASDEPWAAADYRIRTFFNELYKTRGIEICHELCTYTEGYPLLKTILYSMLGHRYFDCGNIDAMRKAYGASLDAAKNVPKMDIHTNAEKWKFSTYFYWARHDPDMIIKESCLIEAMYIPTTYFHRELIITKFMRSLQWLISIYLPDKNGNLAEDSIELGMKSLREFLKDGRITKEEFESINNIPKFIDTKPGTHDLKVGNP